MTPRRTVLITGGTSGLGFATAQAVLTAGGWDVVITGRTTESARAAATRLGGTTTGIALDLGSLADIGTASASLPDLDAVICNAGVHSTGRTRYTADGIEETFGVNHLGHFALVHGLLPRLAAPATVVFVSSGTHDPARRTGFPAPHYATVQELAFPVDDPSESPFLRGRRRYTTSKLCNVLAAYEFARRVSADDATFTVFDPGQMPGTGLAGDYRGIRGFAWRHVLPKLAVVPGNDIHTPRQSAAALARLILDSDLSGATGRYVVGTHEGRSSAQSYDLATAADLWAGSVALIGESATCR